MPFTTGRSAGSLAVAALMTATVVAAPARDARADDVQPNGKATVGGGLLGAEAVTIVEALAGARPGWAYAVGAILGAGAGAVGGHFIDNGSTDGKVPTYMLAGGLVLVIPAVVLMLNATRFQPEEGATEDNVPGPPAEPGAVGGSIVVGAPNGAPAGASPAPVAPPAPAPPAPAPPPQSLLDLHKGTLRLGVPVPDVRPVFSLTEQRQYGMHAETELRMPMLHMTF
jgi:hypothetical protein